MIIIIKIKITSHWFYETWEIRDLINMIHYLILNRNQKMKYKFKHLRLHFQQKLIDR